MGGDRTSVEKTSTQKKTMQSDDQREAMAHLHLKRHADGKNQQIASKAGAIKRVAQL